jgi:ArsR family transcriptional regulator
MEELLLIFKALSDETRLRIVKLLEKGELCVCDIVAALHIVQPKASFHLGVLKEAGLIKDRRQGKWTHYRIHDGDVFRRMLILTALEKVPDSFMLEDRKRLATFRKSKGANLALRRSAVKAPCCGN